MPPSSSGGSNTALIVIIVVVVLGAVGAGAYFLLSGSDDGERQAYVDALVATSDDEDMANYPGLDVECAAGATVDAIGVDNMALTPEEIEADEDYDFADLAEGGLDQEQGGGIFDGFADCGLVWRDAFYAQIGGEEATDSQRQCLDESIDDQLIEDLMVAGLVEDTEGAADVEAPLEEAITACRNA